MAVFGGLGRRGYPHRHLLAGVADHLEQKVQRHEPRRNRLGLAYFADGLFELRCALVLCTRRTTSARPFTALPHRRYPFDILLRDLPYPSNAQHGPTEAADSLRP